MLKSEQVLNDTYRVIEQIGAGGGGIVFKAYHMRLEKYVAVKLIKDSVKGAVEERGEADILKDLKHEGLPQVFDFVNDGDDVYTVMEFIDGGSLYDEIARKGKLPYSKAIKWARELCSAAAYLHTRKPPIIHSDIKPQNIMITSEGRLCLIDFNISSVFGDGVYTVGCSNGYSPPEQYEARPGRNVSFVSPDSDVTELISDDSDRTILISSDERMESVSDNDRFEIAANVIDSRSDVYSIGAVMYSMVTGMKPNDSRKPVQPLKTIDESIPDSYVYIVEKAMSKEKDKRFSSAEEMLAAIDDINKYDKRYRSMRIRQTIAAVFAVVLLFGSTVSVFVGKNLMKQENTDIYNSFISQLSDMNVSKDYSDFDNIYSECKELYDETPEMTAYRALMYYDTGEYEKAGELLSDSIISSLQNKLRAAASFAKADMLFSNEAFEEALPYYSDAEASGNDNAAVYRDHAIALARSGKADEAEKVLSSAEEKGLSEDGILMVTGEILFTKGEYNGAIDALKNVIKISGNSIMRRNAYLVCSKAYSACYDSSDVQMIKENIELLKGAIVDIPQEFTMQIREYLAQAYIDCGEASGNTEYYAEAIVILNDMKSMGWSNYRTEMNIAVLCDRIGDTRTCKSILEEMAATPEYELYYFTIYVRLAYCEADIQSSIDVSLRDYSQFDRYYNLASEAYKVYSANGNTDPEMDKLTVLRNDMAAFGWLS